jgi:peroxiredoxin
MFGALAVAAVVSVAAGYAIGSSGNDDGDVVLSDPTAEQAPPGIGTNAAVQGEALPIVDLTTLDGASLSTADLLGQPLVINVWYSTCIPCKKELPAFAEVHREVGDTVRFVGVNTLGPSTTEERFARDRGVDYELLYDPSGDFVTAVGIATAPVTLFVTPDGTIVRQTGELTAERLRSIIEDVLR